MKYSDYGFRPLYKNFCIYPLNEALKEVLKGQPGLDDAAGVMVYGYVDHVAGNMVEILALTKKEDSEKFSYLNLPEDVRYFAGIDSLIEEEFDFVAYGDSHLYERFKNKIDALSEYDVTEDIAKSRTLTFLDEFRFEKNMDDVKVVLYKEGFQLEGVWAKVEGLGKGVIMGTLLNDPNQDFGVKSGTPIVFFINEGEDKKKYLVADFTPRQKLKSEQLADGKLLKEAVTEFNANKNKIRLFHVLELLRDSNVVVPYTKKGVDILTAKHKSFYPVFSSPEEMWEYDNNITKITMSSLEAIGKALKNDKVEGLVINAFTDSMVIPKSMFEIIEGLESRIEE